MPAAIGRYLGLLGAMVVEGPLVTIGAATASHFGHFNVYLVFVLSVIGDLGADLIYFSIGKASRYGRLQQVWRYLRRNTGWEYWHWFQETIRRHAIGGIALIKLAPVAPGPGLAATGAAGVPVRTFLFATLLVALPKSALFVIFGYFFGVVVDQLQHRFHPGFIALIIAVPAAVIGYVAYRLRP